MNVMKAKYVNKYRKITDTEAKTLVYLRSTYAYERFTVQ